MTWIHCLPIGGWSLRLQICLGPNFFHYVWIWYCTSWLVLSLGFRSWVQILNFGIGYGFLFRSKNRISGFFFLQFLCFQRGLQSFNYQIWIKMRFLLLVPLPPLILNSPTRLGFLKPMSFGPLRGSDGENPISFGEFVFFLIGTIVGKDGNGEDLELGLMIGEMRGSVGQWWKWRLGKAMALSLGVEVWIFCLFANSIFTFDLGGRMLIVIITLIKIWGAHCKCPHNLGW